MEAIEVKNLVLQVMPDADVTAEGEGANFTVTVVSDDFEGASPIQRQKQVMALFKEIIAAGELHALSIKAYTLAERRNVLA